jgi:hypothetical protein
MQSRRNQVNRSKLEVVGVSCLDAADHSGQKPSSENFEPENDYDRVI